MVHYFYTWEPILCIAVSLPLGHSPNLRANSDRSPVRGFSFRVNDIMKKETIRRSIEEKKNPAAETPALKERSIFNVRGAKKKKKK